MSKSNILILIDLDGTLLDSDSKLSNRNKKAVNKMIEMGNNIVIATGRNYKEADILTKDINSRAIISSNGSHIVDWDGKTIADKSMEKNLAKKIINILKKYKGIRYYFTSADEIITKNKWFFLKKLISSSNSTKKLTLFKKMKKTMMVYKHFSSMNINSSKNYHFYIDKSDFSIHKFFAIGKVEEIAEAKKELLNSLSQNLTITSSRKNNLEINSKNISKGNALEYILENTKLAPNRTIAFGDSGNDVELFDKADFSIVMGNSRLKELQEKADIKTLTNNEDGVAVILEKIIDKEDFLFK